MSYTKEQFDHQEMTMAEIEEFAKKLESGELGIPHDMIAINGDKIDASSKNPVEFDTLKMPIMNEKTPETTLTESGIDPTDFDAVKKHGFPLTRKQRRAIERKLNKKLKNK